MKQGYLLTLGSCVSHELCPVMGLCAGRWVYVLGGERQSLISPLRCHAVKQVSILDCYRPDFGFGEGQIYTHSFRIGATSMAATMGFEGPLIQKVGHCKSSGYQLYVHPLLRFKQASSSCCYLFNCCHRGRQRMIICRHSIIFRAAHQDRCSTVGL